MTPTDTDWGLTGAFRDTLWEPFVEGVRRYGLIRAGDRIAVCVSGGKDSMLLAKLMQLWQERSPVPFSLAFLAMDPGYNTENRAQAEANARLLSIPCTFVDTQLFRLLPQGQNPCFLCARMRRGLLYKHAQAMGCGSIALGHHLDDAVETTLLAMLYGSQLQGMSPRIRSAHYPGMSLIRPMILLREEHIIAWQQAHGLRFLQCACPLTARGAEDARPSSRQAVKQLLRRLEQSDPGVEERLFESLNRLRPELLPGTQVRSSGSPSSPAGSGAT